MTSDWRILKAEVKHGKTASVLARPFLLGMGKKSFRPFPLVYSREFANKMRLSLPELL